MLSIQETKMLFSRFRFVESNLDRQVLTGVMIETCNDFFCSQSDVIINDSELVLDLLDVPISQTIVSEKFGLGARTSRWE